MLPASHCSFNGIVLSRLLKKPRLAAVGVFRTVSNNSPSPNPASASSAAETIGEVPIPNYLLLNSRAINY